ncbi:MAG TPA: hypothetical protein VMU54_17005 [Planctomycetota bacterium]|nr:hypothetical protein [Planctomycetota bacterium]
MGTLAWILAAALLASQDETVTSGNVVVRLPPGWKSEQKAEGLYLSPGDLKEDQSYVIIVSPGGKADGNLAEGLEKSWKEFEASGKVTNRAPGRDTKTDGGTEGLFSVGILETKDGSRLIISIAIFKPADRYEAVIALSAQDPVFAKYSGDLALVLKNLRFRNVELPVPYDLIVSSDPGVKPTVFALFRDGSVLSELPADGMDGFNLADAKKRYDGSWGSHETKDGELRLQLPDRRVTLQPEADGSWKGPERAAFVKAGPATGLKLDGRYAVKGREDKPDSSNLVFKPDGSFEDKGTSPPLAGTYEISNNTMKLKFPDRVKNVPFVALPKAQTVLINGLWYQRQP